MDGKESSEKQGNTYGYNTKRDSIISGMEPFMCPEHLEQNKRALSTVLPPSYGNYQAGIQTGPSVTQNVYFSGQSNGWRAKAGTPVAVPYQSPMVQVSTDSAKKKPATTDRRKPTVVAGKLKPGGGGDMKYKDEELEYLWCLCEETIPMGKYEWEHIATRYNKQFPSRPRQEKSLRGQLNAYAKQKPPTGDPDCPPFVKRAKRIMNKIRERAETDILDDPEALANHELPAIGGESAKKTVATGSKGNRKEKQAKH